MVIAADEDVQVRIVPTTARYRVIPAIHTGHQERAAKCEEREEISNKLIGRGHVLIIRKGNIVCESCGMEWSDQGC